MDIRSEPVHPQMKPSMLRSILTDVQLWVPVGVLILGTSLLMILRDS
jgi:hypothetical protein